ncbi:hypothetical protein ONZ43_g2773 [Nemania bipapillata]|uniref:Uncharacterized protein n=1 Tax=Nemania bipapillata TaxID=110536 RepID=A0ACC2IZI3_9PEZI|nr:hypothetical protein ONZ43_g2773 [Nemania bipapillata]
MSAPTPLEQIKRETLAAHRAPHLRAGHRAQPDQIDLLASISGTSGEVYHHSGPYDAALASRNRDARHAPLAAVASSNREALRATPAAHVVDAVTRKVPLHGTASVPPGHADLAGNVMCYEEGADLMRERDAAGGAYRRLSQSG